MWLQAIWFVIALAVGSAMLPGAFSLEGWLLRDRMEQDQAAWKEGQGPVPPEFSYVMFPAGPDVGICLTPDGSRIATLDRAMINTQEELDSGDWIALRNRDMDSHWVKRAELAFDAPEPLRNRFVDDLLKQYDHGPGDSVVRPECEFDPQSNGEVKVTLRLERPQQEPLKCKYIATRQGARPVLMIRSDHRKQAVTDLPYFLGSCATALLSAMVATVGIYFALGKWWRRRHAARA